MRLTWTRRREGLVPRARLTRSVNRVAARLKARGARAIEVGLSGAAVLHWIEAALRDAELVAIVLVACLLAESLAVAWQGGHPHP